MPEGSNVYDNLYQQSRDNQEFFNLMEYVLSEENIDLAITNLSQYRGSYECKDENIYTIQRMPRSCVIEKVRKILCGKNGYIPKPSRYKITHKMNREKKPTSVPRIWDRLIQQCIKQVLDPICEGKFLDCSFGVRPMKTVEHTVQLSYLKMQRSNLHYVITLKLDNIWETASHSKVVKQLWSMGVKDKQLLYIIKKILQSPLLYNDGTVKYPKMGVVQAGILSNMFLNIALHPLDLRVSSQWSEHPVVYKYSTHLNKSGALIKSNGYAAMRKTNLKEMHLVRYLDEIRVFCKNKTDAKNTYYGLVKWCRKNIGVSVDEMNSSVLNLKNRYMEFMGFKMKVYKKSHKYVVSSRICDKSKQYYLNKLIEQIKQIEHPPHNREISAVLKYNSMVYFIHSYFRFATLINIDCSKFKYRVMIVLHNRLNRDGDKRLVKNGKPLTDTENRFYGKSKMLRYVKGCEKVLYPIGYIQHRSPMAKPIAVLPYTQQGRLAASTTESIIKELEHQIFVQMSSGSTGEERVDYLNNKLAVFNNQHGKDAITGKTILSIDDIHCHHIIPKSMGGTNDVQNLIIISPAIHTLIHTTQKDTLDKCLEQQRLTKTQLDKINKLREKVGNTKI